MRKSKMPKQYKKHNNKYKVTTLEDAVSNFLQKITPLLKQFSNDSRLAEVRERQAKAELRTVQAISEIAKLAKEQKGYTERKYKKKSPKILNNHHKKVLKIIANQRNKGKTYEQIAAYLREENIPTFSGRGEWHAQTVHRIYEDNIES